MFDTRTRSQSCDARVQNQTSDQKQQPSEGFVHSVLDRAPESSTSTPTDLPVLERGRKTFNMPTPGTNDTLRHRPHSTGRLMSQREGSPKPAQTNIIFKIEEPSQASPTKADIATTPKGKPLKPALESSIPTSGQLASENCSISVLEAFNKLVRGCDAQKRFEQDPYACLATRTKRGKRCTKPRCKRMTCNDPEKNIQDLLNKMSQLHFTPKELLEAQNLLRMFSDLATCSNSHRKEYYTAIATIKDEFLFSAGTETEHETKEEVTERNNKIFTQECVKFHSTPVMPINSGELQSEPDQGSRDLTVQKDSTSPLVHGSATANDIFNHIFPNARRWFCDKASTCLWQKENGARCGRRVLAQNQGLINDQRMFEKLEDLVVETRGRESSDLLGKLAGLTFCKANHLALARMKIKESLARTLLCNDAASIMHEILPEASEVFKEDSANELMLANFSFDQRTTSDKVKFICKTTRKGTRIKYIPKFVPYGRPGRLKMRLGDWVQIQISRELTKIRDQEDGYIYVYWNEATFGTKKIGFTTGDVALRLQGWETSCKHVAKELYRSAHRIPHVHRLEQIIHAELSDYRVREPHCRGCGKSHNEWFEDLPDETYRPLIERWTKWMMERPYEEDLLRGGGWYLSKLAEEALPGLCEQIVEKAATKITALTNSDKRKRSQFQSKLPSRRAKTMANRRILTRSMNVKSQKTQQTSDLQHEYNLRSNPEARIF